MHDLSDRDRDYFRRESDAIFAGLAHLELLGRTMIDGAAQQRRGRTTPRPINWERVARFEADMAQGR
jgi:hypothetical protein